MPKHYNYNKYAVIWLTAITYSVGISLIALLAFRFGSIKDVFLEMFLITTNRYWYFTAYTGLFFLIPWINKLLRACTKKQMNSLILTIFLLFSVISIIPCYFGEDIFQLELGYSLIWLVLLYIVGAWVKKCEISALIHMSRLGLFSLFGIVVTWIMKVLFHKGFLINYISPTILFFSLFLVVFFSKIKLKRWGEKVIAFFAPAAFGVYIIHIQRVILNCFIMDKYIWIASVDWWKLPLLVIGIAAIVFFACLTIEKTRLIIVDILHISSLSMRLMDKITKLLFKLLARIKSLFLKEN